MGCRKNPSGLNAAGHAVIVVGLFLKLDRDSHLDAKKQLSKIIEIIGLN